MDLIFLGILGAFTAATALLVVGLDRLREEP
jgi:hypothetical protein